MAKDDLENGVFGDVLREDRGRQEQARRGRGTDRSSIAHRPDEHDGFDALVGKKPDPDKAKAKAPSRLKLG